MTETLRKDSLQGRGGEVVLLSLHQKLLSEPGRKRGRLSGEAEMGEKKEYGKETEEEEI